MSHNLSDVHASFLHCDDDDDHYVEKDKELDSIPTVSPGDGEQIQDRNPTITDPFICLLESRLGVHRTSSSNFLALCSSSHTNSPHQMAAYVAARVKERFRDSLSESLLEKYDNQDCIAPFNTNEIVLGRKLGSGGFSHVYKVKSFNLDNALAASVSTEESEKRQHMKDREKYRDTKKSSYALKHLRPELIKKYNSNEYAQFASDLVQEAEFLAVCQHPNIIKLRGTSLFGHNGFAQGPKGYFLIIDRLEETLVQRISKWKKGDKRSRLDFLQSQISTAGSKATKKKGPCDEEVSLLSQQLEVMLQIAAAFVYLHENNIIFRDLKPANVGFDVRGDVKLFDFGLAKMMPSNGDPYYDHYVMSGAGSPRYMAPEVLRSDPTYNLKADVYTFGIVLWEVLSLEKPYACIRSLDILTDHVSREGRRPEIKSEWPSSIKDALQMSFDPSPDERPSMEFFFEVIRYELCQTRNGDDTKLRISHLLRRRTLDSFRQIDTGRNQRNTRNKLHASLASSLTKFGRHFSM